MFVINFLNSCLLHPIGLCYLTPIIGGWYADSKAGKFATILGAGVVYLIGSILLPLGSITHSKLDTEHSNWAASSFTTNKVFKRTVYLIGLILVSIGTGGIKSNVSPFGAEQLSSLGPSAIQGTKVEQILLVHVTFFI